MTAMPQLVPISVEQSVDVGEGNTIVVRRNYKSLKELAEYMNVSRWTIGRWIEGTTNYAGFQQYRIMSLDGIPYHNPSSPESIGH